MDEKDQEFDDLAARVDEWVESAVALDAGHFPTELLSDLEDLVTEAKSLLEERSTDAREAVSELFVSPEMAEVIERFPRVRRLIERAWGSPVVDQIREEASGFTPLLEDDE